VTRRATVFGAYGHTGRFVVVELRKRGWTPVLSGRDPERLRAAAQEHPLADVRVAAIDDPASLDAALAGSSVLINCAKTTVPTAVDETGRSSQVFVMDVIARRGPHERRVIARGRDIYAVTAPIVVEAAQRIAAGAVRTTGVVTAGEAFDAADFLGSLDSAGVSVEVAMAALRV